MWKTNLRPEEQGEAIIVHIGDDVVLKLTRKASVVHVAIDAPRELPIRRNQPPRPMGVDD